jgi:predicted CoA-binding protein
MAEINKTDNFSDQDIKEIYKLRNIAVVGMSSTVGKPSNYVPKFLIEKGYNIIPINPVYTEIQNRKSYGKVLDVPEVIDILDIFRKSEQVLQVIEESIDKEGIKVIWMQKGIYNREAEKIASDKGIKVIYNRCMLEEYQRLFN